MNLKDLKEIKNWLEEMNIKNYDIIKKDGQYIIDVDGNVSIYNKNLKTIPVQFGTVTGHFDCSYNQLTSLQRSPKTVGRSFNCEDNQLTSLQGSPKSVGRSFNCSFNNLTSLKGAPKTVSYFFCHNNPISKEIDDEIRNYNEFIKKYCLNKVLEKLNT